jgi:hypothetical protein
MLVKTIAYTDYDGNERKEDFYFNLNKAELMEMELGVAGGLDAKIKRLAQKLDGPEIMKTFKEIIMKAYGEKSPDGRRLIKSEELSIAFTQTEAYSELLMELCTDGEKAAAFINAILPKIDDKSSIPAPTQPALRTVN